MLTSKINSYPSPTPSHNHQVTSSDLSNKACIGSSCIASESESSPPVSMLAMVPVGSADKI